jgi:two-component system chemotaxis response regulator CheB
MIQVLVVDEHAAKPQRRIGHILQSDPELRVVGEARNGDAAVLTKWLRPDVITMNIGWSGADGLNVISHIMAESPTPIVMIDSADSGQKADITLQAKRLGVASVLKEPGGVADAETTTFSARLIEQVKLMNGLKVIARRRTWDRALLESSVPKATIRPTETHETQVIAIGASAGGPAALRHILEALPADFPIPILVVQHIAVGFIEGLASQLDGVCKLRVKVADHREEIQPGTVFFAPDDCHMRTDTYDKISLSPNEPIGGHRPSVTALFESVANTYGPTAAGLILTGMGVDGARGMQALRDVGAMTIAQDEASCMVFGMPREAIAVGAIQHVVPLEKIPQTMMGLCGA